MLDMNELREAIREIVSLNGFTGKEPGMNFVDPELFRVFNLDQARIVNVKPKGFDDKKRVSLHYIQMFKDGKIRCVFSDPASQFGCCAYVSDMDHEELVEVLNAIRESDIPDINLKKYYIALRLMEIMNRYGKEDHSPQVCLKNKCDLSLEKPIRMTISIGCEDTKVKILDLQKYEEVNDYPEKIYLNCRLVLPDGSEKILGCDEMSVRDLKKLQKNLERRFKA